MVTVAMIVTTKSPTMKILMKVTMSTKTTKTTVLHRDPENDLSNSHFSTVQFLCMKSVTWSSRCCVAASSLVGLHDLVLVSVVPPFFREWLRISFLPAQSCQFLPCRTAWNQLRACALDTFSSSRKRSTIVPKLCF